VVILLIYACVKKFNFDFSFEKLNKSTSSVPKKRIAFFGIVYAKNHMKMTYLKHSHLLGKGNVMFGFNFQPFL